MITTTWTMTTLITTSSITTVLVIMMLELSVPHVSYVFAINIKILTAITVGLVLATIDIVIMLEFLPTVILTADLYTYCPVCDFPGRDMCWLYE